MDLRNPHEIIDDLKKLVGKQGYFYALCMILFEDFHVDPEKLHEINHYNRLSVKEAALLLGFIIQYEVNLAPPKTPEILIEFKKETYELLEELHHSFNKPFFEKLKKGLEGEPEEREEFGNKRNFFGTGEMLIEPMFYSGTGVYDFQYLDYLEKKYKYDQAWLKKNRSFDIKKTIRIVSKIKKILQDKSELVNLYHLKEELPKIIDDLKQDESITNIDEELKKILPRLEFHQYVRLFAVDNLEQEDLYECGWKSFYENIINLFVIKKEDFEPGDNVESFLKNFSLRPGEQVNESFTSIGDRNEIMSHPIIHLDNENFFVPLPFIVFEAVYESPFYWMSSDKKYYSTLSKNRGKVGEEITFNLLNEVFGKENTYKAVKVKSFKNKNSTKTRKDETDIDVFCVLGSKALCVQVKSKKLTELARKGNDEQLKKDFKGAVQDAYEQALLARDKILREDILLVDEYGAQIPVPEEVDEIYLMGVTTENYPSLTHQTDILLNKEETDPNFFVISVFDLELLVYYLKNPFDFLYYVRQRVDLTGYYYADEEITYLGFHLQHKLWKKTGADMEGLDNRYAQIIDRNYYPIKAGIKISDKGDSIKTIWKKEEFNSLCKELQEQSWPKTTDILFHLFDWSGEAQENFVDTLIKTKNKTKVDHKSHNFSVVPDQRDENRVGITYFSLNTNHIDYLENKLINLCELRKYKSKGNAWIGFGSLIGSGRMVDFVCYNNEQWEYDAKLEEISNSILEGKGSRFERIGKKVGRNDPCICGSGLKYKKCCGKVF